MLCKEGVTLQFCGKKSITIHMGGFEEFFHGVLFSMLCKDEVGHSLECI